MNQQYCRDLVQDVCLCFALLIGKKYKYFVVEYIFKKVLAVDWKYEYCRCILVIQT